jgi:hypothetical protein
LEIRETLGSRENWCRKEKHGEKDRDKKKKNFRTCGALKLVILLLSQRKKKRDTCSEKKNGFVPVIVGLVVYKDGGNKFGIEFAVGLVQNSVERLQQQLEKIGKENLFHVLSQMFSEM